MATPMVHAPVLKGPRLRYVSPLSKDSLKICAGTATANKVTNAETRIVLFMKDLL
jgi:hypothetical protein